MIDEKLDRNANSNRRGDLITALHFLTDESIIAVWCGIRFVDVNRGNKSTCDGTFLNCFNNLKLEIWGQKYLFVELNSRLWICCMLEGCMEIGVWDKQFNWFVKLLQNWFRLRQRNVWFEKSFGTALVDFLIISRT